ncbi:MAG: hypothetical protein LUD46_02805 [Parabacteroides sp.]|nr:hypothetical protein [Parabacteroides sp.]
MHLGPIDKLKYIAFACHHFMAAGKGIEDIVIDALYDRFFSLWLKRTF